MSIRRLYFGVENISLTTPQKGTLVSALQALGPAGDAMPSHINHWRVRLDNDALIFEALFDDALLTVAAITTRLATIFGVPAAQITSVVTTPAVGMVAVFSYQAVQKMRLVLFGGASATYQDSGDAARAYLASNAAAWESQTP